jgi:hypothetical protein
MTASDLMRELRKVDPNTIIICRDSDKQEFEPRSFAKWNRGKQSALYLIG